MPAASVAAGASDDCTGRAASARTMASATSSAFRAGAASRRASTDRAAAPTRCAASTAVCAALCEAFSSASGSGPRPILVASASA